MTTQQKQQLNEFLRSYSHIIKTEDFEERFEKYWKACVDSEFACCPTNFFEMDDHRATNEEIDAFMKKVKEFTTVKKLKISFGKQYDFSSNWFNFLDSWVASTRTGTIFTDIRAIPKKNRCNLMIFGIGFVPSRNYRFTFKALYSYYGGTRFMHWAEFARPNREGKTIRKRLIAPEYFNPSNFKTVLERMEYGEYLKLFSDKIESVLSEWYFRNKDSARFSKIWRKHNQ